MLDQFKEQELSNVVWAFAKLHHYDSDMFRKLLAAVSNKLPHFLPQVGRPRLVVDNGLGVWCCCTSVGAPLTSTSSPQK